MTQLWEGTQHNPHNSMEQHGTISESVCWVKDRRRKRVPVDPAIPLLGMDPKRLKNRDSNRYLDTHVHSNPIHNSQKVETTQISISWWMDEQNVVHPHNGMLLIHATMWMNSENIMLNERRQRPKATCCMSPFIWNVQNRQIHRNRKYTSGSQGLGSEEAGEWGEIPDGHRVSFWGDGKVLELDRGDGCKTLQIC